MPGLAPRQRLNYARKMRTMPPSGLITPPRCGQDEVILAIVFSVAIPQPLERISPATLMLLLWVVPVTHGHEVRAEKPWELWGWQRATHGHGVRAERLEC